MLNLKDIKKKHQVFKENVNKVWWKRTLLEFSKVVIISVVVAGIILHFFGFSRVVGESMEPTFKNKDFLIVLKTENIKKQDVVIASTNFFTGNDEYIIKRVIGVEGDVVECKDNKIYVNDKEIKETYIKEKMNTYNWKTIVGKNEVFLMGDNRNNSADSRIIGCVSLSKITGKVIYNFH